jgi:hypothetical protein
MASVVSSCILCLCLGWYGSVWYGMVRCWLVGLVVSLCVAAFFFCIRAQSSHTHLISFVKTSVKSLEAQWQVMTRDGHIGIGIGWWFAVCFHHYHE